MIAKKTTAAEKTEYDVSTLVLAWLIWRTRRGNRNMFRLFIIVHSFSVIISCLPRPQSFSKFFLRFVILILKNSPEMGYLLQVAGY